MTETPLLRLQKLMADRGVASRRKCEEFIVRGLVKVNGIVVTELGTKVSQDAEITLADEVIAEKEQFVTVMLNKPSGVVTAAIREFPDDIIVTDLVPLKDRIFPVGRLDKETTGLILLTNDGELANRIIHPSMECEKEYEVLVQKPLYVEHIQQLQRGVKILGTTTKPCTVIPKSRRSFNIILKEGKNRQIRRMCRAIGNPVEKLRRVRIKGLLLSDLPLGEWRKLTETEVKGLKGI